MVWTVYTKIVELVNRETTEKTVNKLEFSKNRFQLANFLKIFFDFAYYLCVSPFRIAKSEGKIGCCGFHKKVWRPQQVLCAFFHMICLIQLTSSVRKSVPQNWVLGLKNPTVYFHIILELCAFFYKSVTLKRLWLNADNYLKIVNFILKNENIPIRSNKASLSCSLYKFLVGFATTKAILAGIVGYRFVVPIWRLSPSWWLQRLVAHTRYLFWLSNVTITSEAPDLSEITFLDGLLALIMIPSIIIRLVLSELCDLFILSCSLTLWIPAASFEENINEILKIDENDSENYTALKLTQDSQDIIFHKSSVRSRTSPWATVYQNFQAIQTLSELINSALGTQVTWYMAEGLIYYSSNANFVILTDDIFKRIYETVFFVLTVIILYYSADICKKIESAKCWLTKKNNMKTVPIDEAYIVLHEMIAKDIGIRGNNAFTLTYSLVATYLSLIVTFFIICVQQDELK